MGMQAQNVRAPDRMWDALTDIAEECGTSRNEIVIHILSSYLAKHYDYEYASVASLPA